jgi:hypothetical protein
MLYRQVSDLTTHWLLFLERQMCYMSQANYCTLEEKKNQQTDRQKDEKKILDVKFELKSSELRSILLT